MEHGIWVVSEKLCILKICSFTKECLHLQKFRLSILINSIVMNTKKLILLSAAIFVSVSMMTLASCEDKDDNPAGSEHTTQYVMPETDPTADQLTTTIVGKTYVFGGNYTGECKALVNRATNLVSLLVSDEEIAPNEEVENIILHNDKIDNLENSELAAMIMVLAKGGTIAIAEPTIDKLKLLVDGLRFIISSYLEGGNNETAKYVVDILDSNTLDRILMWTDNFDFSVYLDEKGRGDYMTLAIFRDNDSYLAFDVDDELSDYQYGQRADRAAEWINTRESEAQEAAARLQAARLMAKKAGDNAETYVNNIAKSQNFTFDMGIQVLGPKRYTKYHNCTLKYEIWTAYSKEKKCDVYCMTQTVTAYNQILNCGPNNQSDWYDGEYWADWETLNKEKWNLQRDVYGPYMRKIYTKCELKDADNKVTIARYAPQNSTLEGQTDAYAFTYGLGSSAGASGAGPIATGSVNLSWSHTVSRFNPDLTMTASPSPEGVVEWTYLGREADSHYSMVPFTNNTHDLANNIQVTTCTVEQAWVWTVAGSNSKEVTIQPTFQLLDEWLTYDLALGKIYQTDAYHIQYGDVRKTTPIVIKCPPRHIQTWSMSVETKAENADVLKIKNYLTDQLKQYCLASTTFFTKKADHQKSYNENKRIEEYDEIGKFVYTAKDAFTYNKENVKILRQAGKVGGLSDTDSYTVVWRQTDVGINSDREEFTFDMNVPEPQ